MGISEKIKVATIALDKATILESTSEYRIAISVKSNNVS